MGLSTRAWAARVAYALAFTVVLPVALVAWARALDVGLPAYQSVAPGWTLVGVGLAIWLAAVVQLIRRGGGLPMNAFPPPRLVTSGVYALAAHPVYVGFTLTVAGVSLMRGSATGLWLITPLVALGCAALVVGLERPDLDRRFGPAARYHPWLSLPPEEDAAPSWREAVATWVYVLLPWLVAYEGVKLLGQPADAIDARLAWEIGWPVWPWTEIVYASAYLGVPLAAWFAPTRRRLRAFAVQGLVATGVITLVYLCVPVVSPPRPFAVSGALGELLAFEQAKSLPPVAAWPAFHALWAMFAAAAVAPRSRAWAWAAWGWAVAVSVTCVATGMHAVADIAAAWIFFVPLRQPDRWWRRALDVGERLANSWAARRVGPFRLMNHGVYAGAAAAIGLAGMGALAGSAALPGLAIVAACAIAGGALWAQWIEGSPSLLRPFGYYGSVVGALAGGAVAGVLGQSPALVLAATAVMAPWVQAIGRLRCLVQGCCHGRPVDARLGIRVWNPHSRVVTLAGLAGQPIHATQLYSILGNVAIGVLLLRLWFLHAPLWLLTGLYFVLAGLARFMEEGYRGEPQTRLLLGRPMYQYLAAVSVVGGACLTTAGGGRAPVPAGFDVPILLTAALVGAAAWFAMGVDFPDSHRRFARLSG